MSKKLAVLLGTAVLLGCRAHVGIMLLPRNSTRKSR